MAEYRRPFANSREERWPTLAWPREIPIDREPLAVVELVTAYADWMAENDIPKLFVNAEPGAILVGRQREFCRRWRNQTEITVPGSHFIQEDSGREIGEAIVRWAEKRKSPEKRGDDQDHSRASRTRRLADARAVSRARRAAAVEPRSPPSASGGGLHCSELETGRGLYEPARPLP